MNKKGIYSGFIALIALGLIFFIAVSSKSTIYSENTEIYKAKFRQMPLLLQNTRALYSGMLDAGLIGKACGSTFDASAVSDSIGSTYGFSCTSNSASLIVPSASGPLTFEPEISCSTTSPFAFDFKKKFKIIKQITVVTSPSCTVTAVTDA